MKPKVCPVCGVAFLPISRKDKYCGRKCYQAARKGGERRGEMAGYSHLSWACPFFKWDEKQAVHCEGGKLIHPDQRAGKAYAAAFCANTAGWRDCTVARGLLEYYKRKEEETP